MPHKIAIAAGKGGVGKSSVTVNVALALSACGMRVGILDADVYGPSIAKMVAPDKVLSLEGDWIIPAEGLGIYYVSLAHSALGKEATIVRAPIANQIMMDFLNQVQWPALDYLLIDLPPGTGDIHLTLMQHAALDGAILVTTPQEVALLDVAKAYQMLKQMKVPVLGVIENMSYYETSSEKVYIYGQGGGERFCRTHGLSLLGQIPIDPYISNCCDLGESLLDRHPGTLAAKLFEEIALDLQNRLWGNFKDDVKIADVQLNLSGRLMILWSDGKKSFVFLNTVQKHCPCKRCREIESQRNIKVQEELTADGVTKVGNYAIRIRFSRGCSHGIYSVDLLRKLSEMAS